MSSLRVSTGFSPRTHESHDASLSDGPLVLDPERVELLPNELARPVLFEPELWVLVDPPSDVSHPPKELPVLGRLEQALGQRLELGLGIELQSARTTDGEEGER
ncbi:hypothetical protein BT93_A1666 [Corymbia citriodora subsp. variegata]|nr:hypothetical protein BT93_A1666 [Corymbia citriodora subsp. variegata]